MVDTLSILYSNYLPVFCGARSTAHYGATTSSGSGAEQAMYKLAHAAGMSNVAEID